MSENCLFCRIANGDLPSDQVFEDDKVIVFKDIYPKADIHLLIVPRLHIASLEEVNESHDMLMAHMLRL
ncbi:MAG: HIT domain-containing protein, partial [Thiohalomonadales bacterium]